MDVRRSPNRDHLNTTISSLKTAIEGVSYDWKKSEFKDIKFKEGKDIGFIGQEVEKILPEAVSKDDKGILSLSYSTIIPVLVEAFKDFKSIHDKEITSIKKQNDELALQLRSATGEMEKLKNSKQISELETEDDALKKKLIRLEGKLDAVLAAITQRPERFAKK